MREPCRHVLPLAVALAVLGAAPRRASAGDPYDDALAQAATLEAAGRLDEAARFLEGGLWFYPQDYALPLQIAWIHRRAGRLAVAERYYRLALSRSPSGVEARLGLAAVLEAQGRCGEARPLWEGVAAELPDLGPPARAGIARCTPPPAVRVTPSLAFTGTAFPGHPYKSLAGGVTAGLGLDLRSGWAFAATYRYTRFSPASTSALSAWDQHEGYFTVGWGVAGGGVSAHYAVVYDGSGALGTSHHLGISGRWSPFGDIEIHAAGSFYGDMKVLRVEPSWRLPIAFGLSVRPAVGLSDAGGELLATGMATLALEQRRFSLWAGGKYGDEVRPVYLAVPVVYDVLERIPYGAWAGASVNVDSDARIHLSYAMDRLKQADGTATSAHTLTLGAAATF